MKFYEDIEILIYRKLRNRVLSSDFLIGDIFPAEAKRRQFISLGIPKNIYLGTDIYFTDTVLQFPISNYKNIKNKILYIGNFKKIFITH